MEHEYPFTDNQEQWLTALESGDYKQAFGTLRDGGSFCCLGVACDISGEGVWKIKIDETLGNTMRYVTDDGEYNSSLPPTLVAWLGLRSSSGAFRVRDRMLDQLDDLVNLNDTLTYDFTQIAEFIREHPEEVFIDRSEPS